MFPDTTLVKRHPMCLSSRGSCHLRANAGVHCGTHTSLDNDTLGYPLECRADPSVGAHKHILILKLQDEIYQRTRVRMEIPDMWDRLAGMYDLEALDRRVGLLVCVAYKPSLRSDDHLSLTS